MNWIKRLLRKEDQGFTPYNPTKDGELITFEEAKMLVRTLQKKTLAVGTAPYEFAQEHPYTDSGGTVNIFRFLSDPTSNSDES